ncbi:hypothetical protein [Noviherbaspirillum aerium]|uniref:hypothetical protein n=1 Tax=Noviherbaspirillum aerium TaxID=2588497 RepID=UPI00124D44C8|nr:hypothetical protein [Noviherbaspirillum aerium]
MKDVEQAKRRQGRKLSQLDRKTVDECSENQRESARMATLYICFDFRHAGMHLDATRYALTSAFNTAEYRLEHLFFPGIDFPAAAGAGSA